MGLNWFRKTSWNAEDQADFRKRLSRARKNNRAQYLRIQAVTLSEQGKSLAPAAIVLYDEVIAQYPDNKMEVALALSGKAECLEKLGHVDEALALYLQSVSYMRSFPNVRVTSPLDFAWLVARKRLCDYYETALNLLDEFHEYDTFPIGRFKFYGSRALILNVRGESKSAANDAWKAMAAAEEQTSGFRYHALLGLVGGAFVAERAQLAKIAGEPNWLLTLLSYIRR